MLESDGSNLAEVLADRKLKSEGSFNRISEACRKIVPILQAVRLDDAEVTETIETTMMIDGRAVPQTRTAVHSGYEVRLDLLGAANVAAQHASEGTLLALAICTAAMDSRGSPLVLLDEIDRGLHPSAQVSLVRQLQEAIKAFPGLQIIATTHSPDLVDACDAASVRVFNLDSQGHAVVRPLVSHPEAAKWLKLLRVGEFWGTVGEDWVAPKAQQ